MKRLLAILVVLLLMLSNVWAGTSTVSGRGTLSSPAATDLVWLNRSTTADGYVTVANFFAINAALSALYGTTPAANKLPYYTSASAATTTDLTAFARSMLDDANASAVITTLGLAALYQPLDGDLTALGGVTSAANKLPYFTGSGTADVCDLSAFGRSLIDDAAATNARTTLGLVIGTNVLAPNGDGSALTGVDAATGDSATGFFDAGQIESARGGTGGDSSGSTGFPYVTAGTWSYPYTFVNESDFASASATVINGSDGTKTYIDTQIATCEPTITDGSIDDGFINKADLDNLCKDADWEEFTTDSTPYTITPTAGGWGDYAVYFCMITAGTDGDNIKLSETDLPVSGVKTLVIIQNASSNTIDMADVSGQQEVLLDGEIHIEENERVAFQYAPGNGTTADRWIQHSNALSTQTYKSLTFTETEIIPIGYMTDGASAPDALATLTSGTDKVDCRTFAGDADEDLQFTWQIPSDMVVASGLKFRVICFISSATAPSAETWQFELQGFSMGDGDPLDGTNGTAQTSNSGSRSDAQYDCVKTAWSSAMTSTHITDLTAGETASFKLYRDVDDTDTYVQNVAVMAIEFKYESTHDITF